MPLSAELGVRELAEEGRPLVSLDALYRRMVRDRSTAIAEVVGIVARSPGPVLVHCTAGKDRTGVVMAAILAAAGVARADIVADYVETAANMPAVVARVSASGQRVAAAMDALLVREPHLLGPLPARSEPCSTSSTSPAARRTGCTITERPSLPWTDSSMD